VELRLIDYDSLVLVSTCYNISMDDRSFHVCYDIKRSKVTALDFLWWQCVHIGSIWMGRTNLEGVSVKEFVKKFQEGNIKDYFPNGLSPEGCSFLTEIAGGKIVAVKDIELTLDYLAKAFPQTSSRKRLLPSPN